VAKLKTSVKRAGALTGAQSRHVSGMLDALAHCASYSQEAVAVERPEAASTVAANAADEVNLGISFPPLVPCEWRYINVPVHILHAIDIWHRYLALSCLEQWAHNRSWTASRCRCVRRHCANPDR